MAQLATPSAVRAVLEKYNVHLRRSLGQNFLVDANIVRKIAAAAGLEKDDLVFEIGPGTGVLTGVLATEAGRVVALEIDRSLLPVLAETLAGLDNVTVLHRDAMQADLDELAAAAAPDAAGRPYKLVANLPYYITTPLIMRLLEKRFNISRLVVMVQLEVAARLAAAPGGKDYGALSVAVQYYTEPEMLFRVPRTVFLPRPEVDSAVVRLERRPAPAVAVPDEELFFALVRGAFGQRRKTAGNALAGSGVMPGWSRAQWEQALSAAGIALGRRGETLGLAEFAALCRVCAAGGGYR
ncbi:16S rRNA (adenine(1518)-N(6)/adenine(1519)-N(6))-dimethyltransferase RsmA [Desulfotomaculum copahuensis]|uniref:Ribosomal RNA small subunit methyltransferase A n=1 Tax=Desulfotomaculum copahuensis TaxID=1838280 RepID=A0A1B7LFP6_9FIRM|nr:16S rRNA (adenine(1518)-N(6)/adenine(1519)-N(6))-dimethyltransferase RsmA [Desulfotomaculum copahuensis]OAT82965.1 16S rRNA (adenine(1518)-N(6)/adenine(1519)-N(6))-dimethyltransferase [Desulfotomaculum copahuensis]